MLAMGTTPLAVGKVRYVGDPVACVIATDRYRAEDAGELIEVEYDPLPAVTDPEHPLARAIQDGVQAAKRRRRELEEEARTLDAEPFVEEPHIEEPPAAAPEA